MMSGVDYEIAPLDVRELFSFTKSALENAYKEIIAMDNILGVVIISTCNRSEIYLSLEENAEIDPFLVLCEVLSLDYNKYLYLHKNEEGIAVMEHLCQLASGIKSQIWGEDQIITQVKNAIVVAREQNASDNILEVLFRNSIAAAKKIKTSVNLTSRENSVFYKVLQIIKSKNTIKKVMVIGSGEIGKIMVNSLVENGYHTITTYKTYKYKVGIDNDKAISIDYFERYNYLFDCDAIISATLSPHHTIDAEVIKKSEKIPSIFIDLAVPRDIDPKVRELPNVILYDIDTLCRAEIKENHMDQIAEIEKIIPKYINDFEKWYKYKTEIICS